MRLRRFRRCQVGLSFISAAIKGLAFGLHQRQWEMPLTKRFPMTRDEREDKLLQLERRIIQREWCRVMGYRPGTLPPLGTFNAQMIVAILNEEFPSPNPPVS